MADDMNKVAADILSELIYAGDKRYDSISPEEVLTYMSYAQTDICLYLRIKPPLGDIYIDKLKELTKIKIAADFACRGDVKSRSYSEGEVSESEAYLTADDYKQQEAAVLKSLETYRRCRIVK